MPDTEQELVSVFFANSELEGLSVRDLLLQEGIPAILRDAGMMDGFVAAYMGSMAWRGEVLVYARDLDRAEVLVSGFLGNLGLLEEIEPEQQI